MPQSGNNTFICFLYCLLTIASTSLQLATNDERLGAEQGEWSVAIGCKKFFKKDAIIEGWIEIKELHALSEQYLLHNRARNTFEVVIEKSLIKDYK